MIINGWYVKLKEGFWFDGVCKKCGSVVEEGSSDKEFDYMNRCINVECPEHIWHHNYDMEFQDYYVHGTRENFKNEFQF